VSNHTIVKCIKLVRVIKLLISFSVQSCLTTGKSTALLEGYQASPVCLSDRNIKMNMSVERWWNDSERGNRILGEKTCLSATLSAIDRTRNGLGIVTAGSCRHKCTNFGLKYNGIIEKNFGTCWLVGKCFENIWAMLRITQKAGLS
jgi:hypothetical protein